jgi:hypothetical protein
VWETLRGKEVLAGDLGRDGALKTTHESKRNQSVSKSLEWEEVEIRLTDRRLSSRSRRRCLRRSSSLPGSISRPAELMARSTLNEVRTGKE